MVFQLRVEEAQRVARTEMRSLHEDRDKGKKGSVLKYKKKSGLKRGRDDMDAEEG
jgi:ATP-dependent RNA helicase DDX47/RRP3